MWYMPITDIWQPYLEQQKNSKFETERLLSLCFCVNIEKIYNAQNINRKNIFVFKGGDTLYLYGNIQKRRQTWK